MTQDETTNNNVQSVRLKTDCNIFIDRAIEMLKDIFKDEFLVAGYNGVISLLRYAKESHEAASQESNEKLPTKDAVAVVIDMIEGPDPSEIDLLQVVSFLKKIQTRQ